MVNDLRTINKADGSLWYVAADICSRLGISDTSNAVAPLEDTEKGTYLIRTPGGDQQMLIVSELGAFEITARSNHESTRLFLRAIYRANRPNQDLTWSRDYQGQIDRFDTRNVLVGLRLLGITIARDSYVAPRQLGRLLNPKDRCRNRAIYALGLRGNKLLIVDGPLKVEIKREMSVRLGFQPFIGVFDSALASEVSRNAYDPETGELRSDGQIVVSGDGTNVLPLDSKQRIRVAHDPERQLRITDGG